MEARIIKAGLIQMTCEPEKQANIEKATNLIKVSAGQGAQVICLQELFSSRYFCWEENYDYFSLAEAVPGPVTKSFKELARELNVVIIASLFERRTRGIFHNTVAVLDADGSFLGKYRKNHIPDDPGYYEKFYFTPGDTGYCVFNTKFARVGVLICWDQWYPEPARITSLMGAEVLFYPTAIGWEQSAIASTRQSQYQAWLTIQRSHAIANGVYVVAVNRTGTEGTMEFWGGSFVANPFGEVLYQAPHDREDVHMEELDLSAIDESRVHWPFLRDRRIDTYAPILNRFIED